MIYLPSGISNWWFKDTGMEIPDIAVADNLYGARFVSSYGSETIFKMKNSFGSVLYTDRWVEYFINYCRDLGVEFKLGWKYKEKGLISRLDERETVKSDVLVATAHYDNEISNFPLCRYRKLIPPKKSVD